MVSPTFPQHDDIVSWRTYKGVHQFLSPYTLRDQPRLRTSPTLHIHHNVPFALPQSTYQLAQLRISDVEEGIVKYWEQPNTDSHYSVFFQRLLDNIDCKVPVGLFTRCVMQMMHTYLPNFSRSYRELTTDQVLHDMLYDSSHELRHETSSGYGYAKRRKAIAREHPLEIAEYLDTFDGSHEVLFTLFLKEEMREKGKATRSIAVPQLPLWLIYRKYMGWTYKYFERSIGDTAVAYASSPDERYFTDLLASFDPNVITLSVDFKKQDSRMNTLYIQFLEDFIINTTNYPKDKEWILLWIHNESFYNKKVIDPFGNVITFSNGEMSGFPGTLVYNSLYSLFLMCTTQILGQLRDNMIPRFERLPLVLLGDDIMYQVFDEDLVEEIALELGHEMYKEKGNLVNDVSFLSYKFDYDGVTYKPYYSNLDKMWGSLRYAKNDVTYYQKLASFHSLLTFAPQGSTENEWREKLELALETIYEAEPQKYLTVAKSFKPTSLWKKERSYYNTFFPDLDHYDIHQIL